MLSFIESSFIRSLLGLLFLSDCLGGLNEQVDSEAVLGFEAAPLGVGESRIGQLERGQIRDGLACTLEALLQLGAERPER